MSPEVDRTPHRHELCEKHQKYRSLGFLDDRGRVREGGYLVTYEKLGIFIVATIGPYRAVWFTVPGAWKRLGRKFHRHPEIRDKTFGHNEGVDPGEKI